MVLHLPIPRHPEASAAIAAGIASVVGLVFFLVLRRRPTAEEIETLRRTHLANTGRIVDGSLIDAAPTFAQPNIIIYRYRIAGVTYECSQDISSFAHRIHDLDLDLPIQVRYDRANPSDSIVIAESWNGLWSMNPVRSPLRPHAHTP
jgi:hypothetical protein